MSATRELLSRIDAALDREEIITACQDVVRIPSLSCQEAEAGQVFACHFRRLGFDDVSIDQYGNVIARLAGAGTGPSIMFNGHIDHVPVGEMQAPFSAELVDASRWGETGQAIFGRGTCDMKCNVMAGAHAIAAIRRAGVQLRGDVVLVADVGEEVDSPLGVAAIILRGIRAEFGVSMESTQGRIFIGHRGKIDVELNIHGRSAHAASPASGSNAVMGAALVLSAIEEYGRRLADDDVLGPATVSVISIRSQPDNGTAVVPNLCTIRIDRRYVRVETAEKCERELRDLLDRFITERSEFQYDFRVITHFPLMYTDPSIDLVAAASEARRDVVGTDEPMGAWHFGVNGTFMSKAGIPTIGLGPGDEKWAHTSEEHILVNDLFEVARMWARLIVKVCGLV
jgi:putative selenium metabolism hydrolase